MLSLPVLRRAGNIIEKLAGPTGVPLCERGAVLAGHERAESAVRCSAKSTLGTWASSHPRVIIVGFFVRTKMIWVPEDDRVSSPFFS